MATIAHLSDLHIGQSAKVDARAKRLARAVAEAKPDVVLVTGDVTHHGRGEELASFERIFEPVRGRMVVVPGNHDRCGDDVSRALMPGPRVQVEARAGAYIVRVDSTAPHNRSPITSHGELTREDVTEIVGAVDSAPRGHVVVLMLHHHVLPLPEDHLGEQLATLFGWPYAAELARGADLVTRIQGRCDLVLHGHRHRAGEVTLDTPQGRALHVVNAGCSPLLGKVRVISHAAGQVTASRWMDTGLQQSSDGLATFLAGRDARATARLQAA